VKWLKSKQAKLWIAVVVAALAWKAGALILREGWGVDESAAKSARTAPRTAPVDPATGPFDPTTAQEVRQ
jgi:hypothetical protein